MGHLATWVAGLGLSVLLLGYAGPDAVAQTGGASTGFLNPQQKHSGDSKVQELIRRADGRESEGGMCRNIGWPEGSGPTYVTFLEQAATGKSKVNTFKNGQDCQYDRVDVVFRKDNTHCVSYTWWACAGGGSCARGSAVACKIKGNWDTQNSQ